MGIWIAKNTDGIITAKVSDELEHDDLINYLGEWVLRGDTVIHSQELKKDQL